MDKTHTSLSAEAITALEQGRKIEAIKIYREATGVGLKESKEAIEAYLVAHPTLNEQFSAHATNGGKTIVILALIAMVIYWLVKDKF
jgi:ribosomal protein L7/L12